MNISQTLLAIVLTASLTCSVTAQPHQSWSSESKPTSTLTFYYFRDVVSQKYPNRPVQASATKDAQGHEQYTFFDQRNRQTFHDGAKIDADFAQVLAGGTGRRSGAARCAVPVTLDAQHTYARVFFTPEQRARTAELNRELLAWRRLLRTSPIVLTASDVEPHCIVNASEGKILQPVIVQSFRALGAKKYANFTIAHVGEIVGIVVEDKVIAAPFIEEPIMDGQGEISGGFATFSEAQGAADRMNAAARAVSKP